MIFSWIIHPSFFFFNQGGRKGIEGPGYHKIEEKPHCSDFLASSFVSIFSFLGFDGL